jgi:hypothetical protein
MLMRYSCPRQDNADVTNRRSKWTYARSHGTDLDVGFPGLLERAASFPLGGVVLLKPFRGGLDLVVLESVPPVAPELALSRQALPVSYIDVLMDSGGVYVSTRPSTWFVVKV